MKRFRHICVHVTLHDGDSAVLRWASLIAKLANATQVTLLYAWEPVEIPATLQQQYPWLLAPGHEVARTRVAELVAKHLHLPPSVSFDIKIKQGNPLNELLGELCSEDHDLVIINRDTSNFTLAERLARKAPCSVLGVPGDAPVSFQHVLAAFDFSDFSRLALEVASAFASSSASKLSVVHAYQVPWGHQHALVSREQIAAEIKAYFASKLSSETEPYRVGGLDLHEYLEQSHLPDRAIARIAKEQACDLVVIGCRGHGAFYATLLGSTAESILRMSSVPVLAVKAKGSTLALLEQLGRTAH